MNGRGVQSPLFDILTSCHLLCLYTYSFVVYDHLNSILLSTTASIRICVNFIYILGTDTYMFLESADHFFYMAFLEPCLSFLNHIL
jgi:hypothetical protein